MLSCKEATHLMSEDLERTLSRRERVSLRLHLMLCSGCRHFKIQIAFIRTAIRQRTGRN